MYMNSLGFPEMPRGGGGAALLPILQMKLLSLARASYVYLLVVPPIDDRRGRPGLDWSVPLLFF